MEKLKENIIPDTFTIREALACLDRIGIIGNVLFIINTETNKVIGTLTDGDIRRGLLKNLNVNSLASEACNKSFSYVIFEDKWENNIKNLKSKGFRLIPLLNNNYQLLKIIDLASYNGFLPIDVFIMAGGKGARLMPLTKECPKPMLKIGEKPIIEHNIDRLMSFGVSNFTVSINYLGHVIEDYFQDGSQKGIKVAYVKEKEPLGTIGSISLTQNFENEYILVMNSDLLTDIDYSDFFETFKETQADLVVATTPYYVDIPYAVLDMDEQNRVLGLKEKPKFTYYSNAGIYLLKKKILKLIPFNQFYNATDLIEDIVKNGGIVGSFPILSYWLDIGKMPDYLKAQEDIKHLRL
jgi:dTDP-glucose pyrophosphorylase